MTAISRTQVWYTGAYAGFLLGFGAHMGVCAAGIVVGSRPFGPLEGGLFAAAFVGLAAICWAAFFRTNRSEGV